MEEITITEKEVKEKFCPTKIQLSFYEIKEKNRNVMPRWAEKIIYAHGAGMRQGAWVDHIARSSDKKVLMVEPYGLSMESLEDLLTFCKKNDLECEIGATAYHYPTKTIHISIWQKGYDFYNSKKTNLINPCYPIRRS